MKYRQLTSKERYQIEFLIARGKSRAEIARELNRHRSTITRELRRNSLETAFEGIVYDAVPADGLAKDRRTEACEQRYKVKGKTLEYFEEKIFSGWSPEQIAGRLNIESDAPVVSRSSVYRFIEKDREDMFSKNYCRHLRFFRKKRRKQKRGSLVPRGDRRSIRERPAACEARMELGHLERDMMEGVRGKKAVLVIADRKSRRVWLRLADRNSSSVHRATLTRLKGENFKTITNDNGYEFLPKSLRKVEGELGAPIYFSDPHSPWQRGTVENCIGLLRQYFPKRKDLTDVTSRELRKVENLLNNRPRKILNFKTPAEMYFANIEKGA